MCPNVRLVNETKFTDGNYERKDYVERILQDLWSACAWVGPFGTMNTKKQKMGHYVG